MNKAPLIERAREAFAAYRGLGREITDELIFSLTVANAEVARLRADRDRHDRLLEASRDAADTLEANGFMSGQLRAAIAAAEELAP